MTPHPVIPYKEPSAEKPDDIANTMATTLPMVAVRFVQPNPPIRLTREDVYEKQVRNLTLSKYQSRSPSFSDNQDDWLVSLSVLAVLLPLITYRASFVFAVQTWLAQTPEQAKKSGTPGYMGAGMACKSLPHRAELQPLLMLISQLQVLAVGTV